MNRNNVMLVLAVTTAVGSWLTQAVSGPHWITPQSIGSLLLLIVSGVSGIVGYVPANSSSVVVQDKVEPK